VKAPGYRHQATGNELSRYGRSPNGSETSYA
jgi:hypothetical protein